MTDFAPTRSLPAHRRRGGLRNRGIAAAALLFAGAGIGFTVGTSGHAHSSARPSVAKPRPAVVRAAPAKRPTLSETLQQLSVGVKVAAGR